MKNPLSPFFRWAHFVLYEECDDPRAPNVKVRKQLHNAHLIQMWAAMAGIVTVGSIPFIMFFLTLPYFIPCYLGFCGVAGFGSLLGHQLAKRANEREFSKELRSASDCLTDSMLP